MILVYVAGPYTADTACQRAENIRAAQFVGAQIIAADVYPIVPHEMGQMFADHQPPEYWYRATLELMLRCDVVVLTPRWRDSKGARIEHDRARLRGIPVVEGPTEFEAWATAYRRG